MKTAKPGVELLGEVLDGDAATVAETWQRGGFTSMFDFPLAFAMTDVFCKGAPVSKLAVALSNDRRYPDPSRLVTLLDNHDLPRVMSTCEGDHERVRAALAFLLSARGVPSLLWGTEVGLDGAKEPDNRKSMEFMSHALHDEIAFWLEARRTNPALGIGVQATESVDATSARFVRVTADQLAIISVGSATADIALPTGVSMRELIPPAGRSRVRVFVSELSPERFRARFDSASAAQRGSNLVEVNFVGPAGVSVVGSGPELGDWKPERALPLPAKVRLPKGAVFEFKALRVAPQVKWASGANGVLWVDEARRVQLPSVP